MRFEANQGQTDVRVEFLSRGLGYTLYLAGDEAVLTLKSQKTGFGSQDRNPNSESGNSKLETGSSKFEGSLAPSVLRMKLAGAQAAKATGVDPLPSKTNYIIGNDPAKWRTNVPNYARVKYKGVYPGIDLVYYGNQRQLEFDFVVAPGADPKTIAFEIAGLAVAPVSLPVTDPAAGTPPLQIDANGDLVFKASNDSEMRFQKPVVYQDRAGKHRDIEGSYVLLAGNRVGFEVGSYDENRPLIIDPVLSYSTFLGGANAETGYGIAADSEGNIYVAGSTVSVTFPTMNPFQTDSAGNFDVFVTKIDPTGSALVYSSYLGGSGSDRVAGMAVDSSGSIHIAGTTTSINFPTTSTAFQSALAGGTCGSEPCSDAFAAKITADGTGLDYSTYLGGTNADTAAGIALDGGGAAYITGATQSANFPTAAALQATLAGSADAFLTKLVADGTSLSYSTYLGGAASDVGQAVAVDSSGNAVVAGYTFSTDFPTAGALQNTNHGMTDIFVTKINPAGDARVFSTYLGGADADRARAVALDGAGNVYVGGETSSADFPVSASAFQFTLATGICGFLPCADGFLTKLDPAGATTVFSTYLGGTNLDQVLGISVNGAEEAFLTGSTTSDDFPLLNPLQAVIGGGTCTQGPCPDAFVARFEASGSMLIYSTFLGGNASDFGQAIFVDEANSAYLTGQAASQDFPTTPTSFQTAPGGTSASGDAFAVRIGPADLPSLIISSLAVTFEDQPQGFESEAQVFTLTNPGTAAVTFASITATGDFEQTNTCEPTLALASASCTIAVTFTPTTTGVLTGEITVTSDVTGSPHQVTLTGTGIAAVPAISFSPEAVEFPDRDLETTSDPVTVTITNSGFADLTITRVDRTGDYAQTNNCPISPNKLVVGASCTADVTFTPTGSGIRSGSLFLTSDAGGTEGEVSSIALIGKGIGVFTLSSPSNATTLRRGTQSTTFTVEANGPESFTGAITLSCQESTAACSFNPASILVGETSTLTVSNLNLITAIDTSFTVIGTNELQFAEVTFNIIFADFSLTPKPTFGTVASGDSFVLSVTLASTHGFDGTVSFLCANLPQESSCTFSPTTVTLDGTNTATVDVTIKTTTRVATWTPPRPRPPFNPRLMGGLGLLTLCFAIGAGRRRVRLALLAATLLAMLLAASCNDFQTFEFTGTLPGTFDVQIGANVDEVGRATRFFLTVL